MGTDEVGTLIIVIDGVITGVVCFIITMDGVVMGTGELGLAIMEVDRVTMGTEQVLSNVILCGEVDVLACILLIVELSEVEVRVIDDLVPVLVLPVVPP